MSYPRVGSGLDIHPFASEDRPLVLGGVEIPDAPGLEGHSDADVVAHALADALLGAVAAGDLGSVFGTEDPALADADSSRFVTHAQELVAAAGFEIANVDLTVVAQRPRLAAHREAMESRLAEMLDTGKDRISVKISSTDELGTIGRGEGIACWATCLVVPR